MPVLKKKPKYVPRKVLPADDKRWEEACEPLLEFLIVPRSWRELEAWSSSEKVPLDTVRNMLAWLSLNKHATYDIAAKTWAKVTSE